LLFIYDQLEPGEDSAIPAGLIGDTGTGTASVNEGDVLSIYVGASQRSGENFPNVTNGASTFAAFDLSIDGSLDRCDCVVPPPDLSGTYDQSISDGFSLILNPSTSANGGVGWGPDSEWNFQPTGDQSAVVGLGNYVQGTDPWSNIFGWIEQDRLDNGQGHGAVFQEQWQPYNQVVDGLVGHGATFASWTAPEDLEVLFWRVSLTAIWAAVFRARPWPVPMEWIGPFWTVTVITV